MIRMDRYHYIEEGRTNEIPICVGVPVQFEKPKYNKFIYKVLLILCFQFTITTGFAITGYTYRHYLLDKNNYLITYNLLIYSIISFIISSLIIICCRFTKKYILYPLFIIFTISSAILVTVGILPYSPNIVLLASLGTLICIFISMIYALLGHIYNFEMTMFNGITVVIAFTCLPLALIQAFLLDSYNIIHFLLAFLFIILFNTYLMYDIHTLYNHTNQLMFESPIYPAISIYLDIINIFLYLLECINLIENNN